MLIKTVLTSATFPAYCGNERASHVGIVPCHGPTPVYGSFKSFSGYFESGWLMTEGHATPAQFLAEHVRNPPGGGAGGAGAVGELWLWLWHSGGIFKSFLKQLNDQISQNL